MTDNRSDLSAIIYDLSSIPEGAFGIAPCKLRAANARKFTKDK
jgi:hypothetical protein